MEWKLRMKYISKEYYYCSNKSIYKCKATMKKFIESNLEQKTGHSNKCLRYRKINGTMRQKNISHKIENISFNKEQENVLLKEKLELMEKLLKREKDFEEIHKDILDLKNKFEERNNLLRTISNKVTELNEKLRKKEEECENLNLQITNNSFTQCDSNSMEHEENINFY